MRWGKSNASMFRHLLLQLMNMFHHDLLREEQAM
jgi:hypothetical protein